MAVHAYLFETRAIQSFLFSSGKLKDLIGGSELIDYLCKDPLTKALEVCGLKGYNEKEKSPRCAGGTFYLIFDDADLEKAKRFRQIWPLIVAQFVPGVEQIDAWITNKNSVREAIDVGLEQLKIARNKPYPSLPLSSPLTERSQRTGFAAVKKDKNETIDEATKIKRQFIRPQMNQDVEDISKKTLTGRFCKRTSVSWPTHFEKNEAKATLFPLSDKDGELIALLHADGNGLGEVLRVVNEAGKSLEKDNDYIELYRQFSDGLEKATILACQKASDFLTTKITPDGAMPARPIVLGGDDLTAIISADLVFEFTEKFMLAFEEESEAFLTVLKDLMKRKNQSNASEKLPSKLTACAGIVFMKPSQPFAQCYNLAEGLCSRAKKISRSVRTNNSEPIPASIAFHRLQSTLIGDAEDLFDAEMTVKNQPDFKLAYKVYGVNGNSKALPQLSELKELAQCFSEDGLNENRMRSLLTLMHLDPILAKKDYQRFRKLSEKNSQLKQKLEQFDLIMSKLLFAPINQELPIVETKEGKQTVLADLIGYLTIQKKS